MTRTLTSWFVFVAALAGCSSDNVGPGGSTVGGPCTSSSQCDSVCQQGGDYPQGECTVACRSDADCPDTTFCIDKENGICMLGCSLPADCRGGYSCEGKQNKTTGGDSLVCVN